jgi:hypothetical protein
VRHSIQFAGIELAVHSAVSGVHGIGDHGFPVRAIIRANSGALPALSLSFYKGFDIDPIYVDRDQAFDISGLWTT